MARDTSHGYYAIRWQILQRDNFTCQYCGQYAPDVKLEVDHIIAVSDGGDDEPANLKTACYACNKGKESLRIKLTRTKKRVLSRTPTHADDIYKHLHEDKTLKVVEIAAELGKSVSTCRVALSLLKKRGLVENPTPGKWKRKSNP